MKKLNFITLALFLVAFLSSAHAQSVEEILKKHYEAAGYTNLADVNSYYIKAKVSQMGMDLPMEMKIKKPNKFRMEIEMQGQKMVQAYDGEKGWLVAPWLSPDPQELSGDQLKQAIQQTDLEGELYNYKQKGHSIEFTGKVNLDGKETYKLKLTNKDGSVKSYFIDAGTNLVVQVKAKIEAAGQTIDVNQKMLDYKKIDGVNIATKIESESPMGTATVVMEEVKFNVDFDDAIFKQPAK